MKIDAIKTSQTVTPRLYCIIGDRSYLLQIIICTLFIVLALQMSVASPPGKVTGCGETVHLLRTTEVPSHGAKQQQSDHKKDDMVVPQNGGSGTDSLSLLLRKEIAAMLLDNYGNGTNLHLIDFPDNLIPLPKWRGSTWDDTTVTGFVKCPDGCRKVKMRRNGDGLGGRVTLQRTISHDTVRVAVLFFQVNDKLLFTGREILIMTAGGDTVSRWGSDLDEPAWPLRLSNNDCLEFSDGSDPLITLRAYAAFTDTIVYRCRNRDSVCCLRKRDIAVMASGNDVLSAVSSRGIRIIHLDTSEVSCDDSGLAHDAIDRINTYFDGKRYIVHSGRQGFRIWRKKEQCANDRESVPFPFSDEP